jgi:hypothetical protein
VTLEVKCYAQLFVKENQAVVVTNSSVYVIDVDTSPDQLQLKVDVSPQHGMAVTTVFVEISFVVLFIYLNSKVAKP